MQRSRRIITRGVIDMATSQILESEGYVHTGPVAECDSALADITRSIEEIGTLAKAGNVEVTKQIGEIKTHTESQDQRILALEQKVLAGSGAGGGAGARASVPNLGQVIVKGLDFNALQNRHAWVRSPIPGTIADI